jgi:hypothetical protein
MKRPMTAEQLLRRLARRSPGAQLINLALPAGASKRKVALAMKPYREAMTRMCVDAFSAEGADRRRGS